MNKFIQQLSKKNKKIIGICFGHQIIAQALGGLVSKSNNGWGVGLMSSTVIKNQTWMRPAHNSISLLGIHQDQVIELPKDAVLLAESDFCPNSSFQIGNTILTFQGHPEFSKDYLLYMMNNRREILGEQIYKTALSSLDQETDVSLVVNWISNFLHTDF